MNSDGNVQESASVDEYLLKICVIGFPDEILTASLRSYSDGPMDPSTRNSFGYEVPTKQIRLDNDLIRLILFDISNKHDFGRRIPGVFRGSSAAIFAFSHSNLNFIDSLKKWYYLFREYIPQPTVPIAFIGVHGDPEVTSTSGSQELAQELGGDYYEMVVDDLQTLDVVLRSLSRKVLDKRQD